jgi:uncharacterized protein
VHALSDYSTTENCSNKEEVKMSNLETAKQAYRDFQIGNIAGVMENISDQCQWRTPGPRDILPWAGQWQGKEGIAKFFTALAGAVTYQDFTPTKMIEEGDTIIVLGKMTGTANSTGKTFTDSQWVHVLQYDDGGKLIFFQSYQDTAEAVATMTPESGRAAA